MKYRVVFQSPEGVCVWMAMDGYPESVDMLAERLASQLNLTYLYKEAEV